MAEMFQATEQDSIPAVFRGKLAEKLSGSDEVRDALRYADTKGMVVWAPEF